MPQKSQRLSARVLTRPEAIRPPRTVPFIFVESLFQGQATLDFNFFNPKREAFHA
jgi:hypothetical protein